MNQASYLAAGCCALSLGVMSHVFAFSNSQDVTNYEQFDGNFSIDDEDPHRINPRSLPSKLGGNWDASIQRSNNTAVSRGTGFSWEYIRNVSYEYVASDDEFGKSQQSMIVAPAHLTIEVVTNKADSQSERLVELYWYDDSNNESQLIIERCQMVMSDEQSICLFEPLANVAADVTTFSDRPGMGLYKYRIKAINATASSDYSNIVGT